VFVIVVGFPNDDTAEVIAWEETMDESRSSTPIRVIIADDHPLFRKGVRAELDPEKTVDVVGMAKSFDDLMSLLETVTADVVLLDLGGMGPPARVAVSSLVRTYPQLAIIILSSSIGGARELLQQGARGYMAKEDVEDEVIMAIHTVMRGEEFLSPGVIDYLERSSGGRKHNGITPREWEVFRLNAEGHSTEAIADLLKISYNAVGNYISSLYRKVECRTRTQLAECYRRIVGLPS